MLLNILFNEISEISEKIKCEKLRIKAKNCECLMELRKFIFVMLNLIRHLTNRSHPASDYFYGMLPHYNNTFIVNNE